jgi:hypothetical protein
MTRSISVCTLIAAFAVMLICVIYHPSYISDSNDFLHHFVNHELLALLGIIMTITLASAASLHFEFNKIEERFNKRGLTKTRRGVMQGAYCLIFLFLSAVALVVFKPLVTKSEVGEALINGLALLVVLINALILLELTQLAFSIQPEIRE